MTDKIIDEVLRHDAEMTEGPWAANGELVYSVADHRLATCQTGPIQKDVSVSWLYDPRKRISNRDGIAYYRTAAPKLARALKRAMEALRKRIGCSGDGQANIEESALVDITKILQEP